MTNTTSLAEINAKYEKTGAHLLLPVSGEVQLNPFYKYSVMEVKADVSENSGDIFKVGSVKTGYDAQTGKDIFEDVFSPAKPLLMKLAAAAGIQFQPEYTYGEYVNKNCYRAKAYGAIRLPDGTGKTHSDEKVINLEDEEDRLRLEFMDKSIEGITEWRAAKAAEKMFKGEWADTGEKNAQGYPIKKFVVADVDRQKYIERSVLVNMTLLRKTFAEKAMTGAILRVIRALVGMKGTYTKKELAKPFVVPRVTFSPDYNDHVVRQAMLEQGMNSVSNMFGGQKSIMAAPPIFDASELRDNFNPEEFADNAAFASDQQDDDFSDDYHDMQQPIAEGPPMEPKDDDDNPNVCSECNTGISDKVAGYSIKKYGRPLCYSCQKGGEGQ